MVSCGLEQLIVVDDGGGEPDLERALRVDGVAEQQQFGGASQADDPRQEVRRSHVGARQPDLGEEEGEPR